MYLQMDATFKVVPRRGTQLFMLQVYHERSVYAILYALMVRKTQADYSGVLEYIRNHISGINVASIMSDWAVAIRECNIGIPKTGIPSKFSPVLIPVFTLKIPVFSVLEL